ncbi:MAG TPA: hypothetical protein VGV93_07605 [Acidimicrobiales bacterium]|nr:hypothetical protein [Acidimicrobiales bacterium]
MRFGANRLRCSTPAPALLRWISSPRERYVVAAHETGLLRHIPDPPGRWFDSDKVDAPGEAYKIALMPDALLGMASAVATAELATAGAQGPSANRWQAGRPLGTTPIQGLPDGRIEWLEAWARGDLNSDTRRCYRWSWMLESGSDLRLLRSAC